MNVLKFLRLTASFFVFIYTKENSRQNMWYIFKECVLICFCSNNKWQNKCNVSRPLNQTEPTHLMRWPMIGAPSAGHCNRGSDSGWSNGIEFSPRKNIIKHDDKTRKKSTKYFKAVILFKLLYVKQISYQIYLFKISFDFHVLACSAEQKPEQR